MQQMLSKRCPDKVSYPVLHLPVYRGETVDVFRHEDAVYGLSIDPNNVNVFASACDDGRVLIYDIREPASTGEARSSTQ